MTENDKNNSNKFKAWIGAMRLRTLPLSFSVILTGGAMAYSFMSSRPIWKFDFPWFTFALILITTLLLQILSNLANDYGDAKSGADNDGRIGPTRAIQSGVISPEEMRRAIVLNAGLALISGIWLLLEAFNYNMDWIFIAFLILGLCAIAAAIKYTVGKKAYGYSGFGDLFVFLFFGLLGVMGTFYLLTSVLPWQIILPATTMGCYSVAVLNLNNMRDRENDQLVGKNTLAVKLGFKRSKLYHYLIFILAYIAFPIPVFILATPTAVFWIILAFIPSLIIHIIHLRKVYKIENPKDFDPELKKVALSAFLFSVLFFAMMLLVH